MSKQIVKPQLLKGFRDFLPTEARKRQWLKDRLIKIFEEWGFEPLETPTLEPLELFEGKIGEDEKLFYKFTDAGGRRVALRYDQTVPACRVVGQSYQNLPWPFKRYQIQPAFRAEKPQRGRYREFLQADADIFGSASAEADAEVIALSLDIYRQLGFKQVQVLINNRKLMAGIPYSAIVVIDKLKKIGKDGVISEMTKKGFSLEQARKYLETALNSQPDEAIKTILEYLAKLEFSPDWYRFDPTITRSFAYSDGPIWEVEIPGFEGGSVLGGERFDGLTKKIMGIDIPATGFGLGFDRTLEAAEQFKLIPAVKTAAKVLVTIFKVDFLAPSLMLLTTLRKTGINSEIYPDSSVKLDKQLKYADKKGIPYAVIIGPDEAAKDKIRVKKMQTGEQKVLPLEELVKLLQN